MAYCVDCGMEIPEGAVACPQCGKPVGPQVIGRQAKTSGLAIASLILSILGIFSMGIGSILGIILGIVALIKIRNSNGEVGGTGLAAAGVALGGVVFFMGMILAAIAIPNFLMFQKKAKMSEAKTNLGGIFTAEVAYHGEYNAYGRTFEDIGWGPWGSNLYSYYICDDVLVSQRTAPPALPPGLDLVCEDNAFRVFAVGNLDHDDFLDVWSIDDMKQLRHEKDDISNH